MIETNPYTSKSVILFDGYCNLCSWAVQFVVKRDKKKKFKFASLQSEYGIKILLENNLPATDFNSLVLVEIGKIYTQSTGALKIARSLSGLWPIFYAAIILPAFIRDGIYNLIARNRYKWFGRKEACFLLNDNTLFIDK
ncbi:MAG: DCC1-like thiol-disulfide oxidoreductase family protein [Bacteroidota bacterium]